MPTQPKSELLRALQSNLRIRHYSPRTEEAYLAWVRRFVRFHRLRHPEHLGDPEVAAFLGYLATERRASASTLNQALAALQLLYRDIVRKPLGLGKPFPRPKPPLRIPVVLTPGEVGRVLGELTGTYRLIGMALNGSGLRLLECLTLRVKDLDLERGEIRLRRGKGGKDRITVLAASLRDPLREHLAGAQIRHQRDLAAGGGWVALPDGLDREYPNAGRSWPWQWVFPAARPYRDRANGPVGRPGRGPGLGAGAGVAIGGRVSGRGGDRSGRPDVPLPGGTARGAGRRDRGRAGRLVARRACLTPALLGRLGSLVPERQGRAILAHQPRHHRLPPMVEPLQSPLPDSFLGERRDQRE
ncbi:MAG: hypothetical protein FJ206_11615 [Gemmatimonadetes bacterium]|nr:hypothetical protein [Gemmatimonadota bacterium]